MNVVMIIGRLTKDPELSYIPNTGTAVTNFTVAVDKGLSADKKKEFEGQGKPTADFIPVVVYGKTAENCANYLKKGSQCAVNGSISTRSYMKENERRYITEINAFRVEFLNQVKAQGKAQDKFPEFPDEDFFEPTEDPIPF